MNRYLMKVRHYFRGYEEFEIEAENKEDAINKGMIYVRQTPHYSFGGNYDLNDIKCVKKLKPRRM